VNEHPHIVDTTGKEAPSSWSLVASTHIADLVKAAGSVIPEPVLHFAAPMAQLGQRQVTAPHVGELLLGR
jgi:hypothetical protein